MVFSAKKLTCTASTSLWLGHTCPMISATLRRVRMKWSTRKRGNNTWMKWELLKMTSTSGRYVVIILLKLYMFLFTIYITSDLVCTNLQYSLGDILCWTWRKLATWDVAIPASLLPIQLHRGGAWASTQLQIHRVPKHSQSKVQLFLSS